MPLKKRKPVFKVLICSWCKTELEIKTTRVCVCCEKHTCKKSYCGVAVNEGKTWVCQACLAEGFGKLIEGETL